MQQSAMTEAVLYETRGPVAIITINRPEARNAMNQAVREGFSKVWPRFEQDASVRVGILAGAGPTFCAGLDLKEAADLGVGVPPRDWMPVLGDNFQVSKPVIAAVQGYAYAGGWLLAQMCDLCVADEAARFAITEARVGRGMPWAAPLINMLPQRIVLELTLTGDPLTAQRAYELGYVNRLAPTGQALDVALEMAQRIADNAPLTVSAAREMVRLSTEMGTTAARSAAIAAFEKAYLSEDALEGPRAFREKRKPVWKGR